MERQTATDILAASLGIDAESARSRFDAFSGGIVAELLEKGRVAVDGLGTFTRVHDHASRESTAEGARFLPPRNRIAFDGRSPGVGDSSGIVHSRMKLSGDDARALALALAKTFNRCRQDGVAFSLRGVGEFSPETGGAWRFTPSPSIDGLLNTAYDGLKAIDMPSQPGSKGPGAGFLKPMGIAALVVVAGIGGYVAFRGTLPADSGRPVASERPASAAPIAATAADVAPVAAPVSVPPAVSAEPDSLTLAKGRFTVVVSTFSSMNVAGAEARRLAGLGLRTMIWPIRGGGKSYFRIVTGDFESHREASDSLQSMSARLPGKAYIQQAYKTVVIYGAKGL